MLPNKNKIYPESLGGGHRSDNHNIGNAHVTFPRKILPADLLFENQNLKANGLS